MVTARAETSEFQLKNSDFTTPLHGWSIQQLRPTSGAYPDPDHAYLIYIRLVNGELEVSHEYSRISVTLEDTEKELLTRARDIATLMVLILRT